MNKLHLTETAISHFAKKLQEAGQDAFVCVRTKKTGCSGLSYVTEILKTTPDPTMLYFENAGQLPIYLERDSVVYLQGMTIDYQTEGLQSKLVYINPNETGRCGCGESFSVDKPAE